MIAVKTCGKLYWAGEYAILEPGQLALIKAIPIYMKAEIAFSETYRIYSDLFDFAVDLTPNPDYSLIQETIALVGDFLAVRGQTLRPFSLKIRGKMEREGKKFGLGSSGSVVVLVVKALLTLYNLSVNQNLLFKLAFLPGGITQSHQYVRRLFIGAERFQHIAGSGHHRVV